MPRPTMILLAPVALSLVILLTGCSLFQSSEESSDEPQDQPDSGLLLTTTPVPTTSPMPELAPTQVSVPTSATVEIRAEATVADLPTATLLSTPTSSRTSAPTPTLTPTPAPASAETFITDGPTIVSSPSLDSDDDGIEDTYVLGDIITIRIGVSEQSCGHGMAILRFQTGDGPSEDSEADFGGCGSDAVYFEYTVTLGDLDGDGLSIPANSTSLTTYEGIIQDTVHPAVLPNPDHRVNASPADTDPPRILGSPNIVNVPLGENALRVGDQMLIRVRFGEQVIVDTGGRLPTVVLDMAGGIRKAQYIGKGEDPTILIFGYMVQARDRDYIGVLCVPAPVTGDGAGITVPPGSSITDNAGNRADLSWADTSCHFGLYLNEVPASPTSDLTEWTLVSISAGTLHTCGVRRNGSVICWGSNEDEFGNVFGQATPPEGEFDSISTGLLHTCGVKRDDSVACWGWGEDGQAAPPEEEFDSVSAGLLHTCGVKRDGSVACWGWNKDGQATPPAGKFTSISAGAQHTCGVRTGGSLACWGSNDSDQAAPPSGEFVSVGAGLSHTCGVKRDSLVACWGSNENLEGNVVGQAMPLVGEFTSVSAGALHTCGVKRDGSVACWGSNEDLEGNVVGQATPPAGEFASISAGALHTCGVKRDGSVACWGLNEDGQSTPPD